MFGGSYRTYRRHSRPSISSRTAMMMTELKTMMTITAQVGMTRVMVMGGDGVGGGLLLSIA